MKALWLIEWYQSRRALWKQLILFFCIAVGFRYLFDSAGVVLGLLLLPANLSIGMGVGTFGEEIAKGQMRFLQTLPVARGRLFLVKLLSGLIGLTIFLSAVALPLLAFPGWGEKRPLETLETLGYDPGLFFAAVGIFTLFNFTAGLLAVLVCRSTKTAAIAGTLMTYVVLGSGFLMALRTGEPPNLVQMSAAMLAATPLLLGGAWWTFRVRNPYYERVWVWRRAGAAAAVAGLGAGAAVLAAPLPWGDYLQTGSTKQLVVVVPHPAGDVLFAVAADALGQTRGVILDAGGNVLWDIGRQLHHAGPPEVAWRPGARRQILLLRADVNRSEPKLTPVLADLDRRRVEPLAIPDSYAEHFQRWMRWTADGAALLAVFQPGRQVDQATAVRLDVESGAHAALPLEGVEAFGINQYLPDGRLVVDELPEEGGRRLRLFDPAAGTETQLAIPRETQSFVARPGGGVALLEQKSAFLATGYEVAELDPAGGRRVLVPSTQLPRSLPAAIIYIPPPRMLYLGGSPTGGRLYLHALDSAASELSMVDAANQRLVPLVRVESEAGSLDMLTFSRSEARAFCTQSQYSGEGKLVRKLHLFELAAGEPRAIGVVDLPEDASQVSWLGEEALSVLRSDLESRTTTLWRVGVPGGEWRQVYPRVDEEAAGEATDG